MKDKEAELEILDLVLDHTHLLLVGPEASTSDCSLGKKPCWYLPWPIFMSNKCG